MQQQMVCEGLSVDWSKFSRPLGRAYPEQWPIRGYTDSQSLSVIFRDRRLNTNSSVNDYNRLKKKRKNVSLFTSSINF